MLSKFVTRWPSKVKDLSLNRFLPLELFDGKKMVASGNSKLVRMAGNDY